MTVKQIIDAAKHHLSMRINGGSLTSIDGR